MHYLARTANWAFLCHIKWSQVPPTILETYWHYSSLTLQAVFDRELHAYWKHRCFVLYVFLCFQVGSFMELLLLVANFFSSDFLDLIQIDKETMHLLFCQRPPLARGWVSHVWMYRCCKWFGLCVAICFQIRPCFTGYKPFSQDLNLMKLPERQCIEITQQCCSIVAVSLSCSAL